MKAGLRKALFVLSAIFGGLGALFIFIGICVGLADIPNLYYPLTVVLPMVYLVILDVLMVLLPIILHRYWKEKPCKKWWKVFGVLFGIFFVLSIIARPINIAIQENNIMYVPHEETERWIDPQLSKETKLYEMEYLAPENWRSKEATSPEGWYYYPYEENADGLLYVSHSNMDLTIAEYQDESKINGILQNVLNNFAKDREATEQTFSSVSSAPAIFARYRGKVGNNDADYEHKICIIITPQQMYSIIVAEPEQLTPEFEKCMDDLISSIVLPQISIKDIQESCNHSLQETVIKEATEESKGEKQYYCTICGYSKIEEIPMLEPTPPETTAPQKIEILFREIPWGTTSKDAKQLLKKSNSSASTSIWEKSYILYPSTMLDIGISSSDGVQEGGSVLYAHNLTAGGYDVQMAQLHFAYTLLDGKIDRATDSLYAALYYFDVVEHEAVYKDLQQKMSDLYGSGKESSKMQSGWIAASDYSGRYEYAVKQITWYGDNNTFVTLQWVSSTNQADSIQNNCGISMLYGKTDAKSMLDNLEKALEQEKANADKENASGNSDGL